MQRQASTQQGERARRGAWRSLGLARDEGGVSPVVGMILVLTISVTGIIAILTWGAPAIADLKARVEFEAVNNQFVELNADVDELIRGTSGKTAKRWRPSFNQGSMALVDDRERWIVGVDLDADKSVPYNWTLGGLFDTDNAFSLYNNGTEAHGVKVFAWTLDGGSQTPVNVSYDDESNGCADEETGGGIQMGSHQTVQQWQSGSTADTLDLCLFKRDGSALGVRDVTLKVVVENASEEEVAKFFLNDVGAFHYTMDLGQSQREAYHTNGAIIEGLPNSLYVANAPPFGPPRESGGEERFFARLVTLTGNVGVGGPGRFDVLMSLYATSTLSDDANAEALKVWVSGDTHDAWFEYFLYDNPDYDFEHRHDGTGFAYVEYRPAGAGGFDFKLVHSTITVQ